MNGIEILQAIRDGELPRAPIQDLLGFDLAEVGEGSVVFTAVPGPQHSTRSASCTAASQRR